LFKIKKKAQEETDCSYDLKKNIFDLMGEEICFEEKDCLTVGDKNDSCHIV